ncbi:unnamed protein product [Adineta steineri]|uniref:Uncharacterized protein n=2 Tax=Adineta steineri TaxID=433720 RepID=A0A819L1Z3_9BILA|nr:unnamed protein product [Adineta steineri]
MHVNLPEFDSESYTLKSNPSSPRSRPSITLPVYRSWSPHSRRRHSSVGDSIIPSSIDSRPVVNKLVLDIRKSLFKNNNIPKPSNEQTHTNENTQKPQCIGEERQDNAIYKVYLKRVRHKSSTLLSSSSTINTLADDKNEDNKTTGDLQTNDQGTLLYSTIKVYQLKAGTLEKIVECLTNDQGELDTTHMYILFSTYRTFTNTRTLIDTLIQRYRTVLPASLDMTEDIRQKTLKNLRLAITCLLSSYKEDFCEPPYYPTLNYLLKHLPDKDIQKQGEILLEQLKNNEEDRTSDVDNNNNKPKRTYLSQQKGFDYLLPWNFIEMSSTTVAEQLTIVDADLLKSVLTYECLTISTNGCSRRTALNNSNRLLSTVDKTIEYFNAVVARVVATILKEQDEKTRANVIEKWIDVAHQCRKLKNFSSLTAILNGLLSGCIYRLSKAWSYVTEDYWTILEELKNVFGSCADRKQARAILDKEGTAKYVDSTTMSTTLGRKFRHKSTRDHHKSTMIGTVPYLGIYLSDLTYIDSAYPNTIDNESNNDLIPLSAKLINFEKHRKQFEILAQIKLFQSAANAYVTLHPLPRFKAWFDSVRTYTDTESWDLSYQIEAKEVSDNHQNQEQFLKAHRNQPLKALFPRYPSQVSLDSLGTSNHTNNGHTDSTIISNGSIRSSPSSASLDKMSLLSSNSLQQHQQSRKESITRPNQSRSSSVSSLLTSSNGSSSQGYISATASPTISTGNFTITSTENETVIAKVKFAGKDELLYKKVRIKNDERTTSVLKTILDKFGFDPTTYDRYCIEQILPDRKILLLDHCNVFYALARSSDDEQVELIVREKTRHEREQKSNCLPIGAGHNRTPSGLSISSTHSR